MRQVVTHHWTSSLPVMVNIGTSDSMYDALGSNTSENTRLTTALRKSTLNSLYDFGKYWAQRIKVEKKLSRAGSGVSAAVLRRRSSCDAAPGLRRSAGIFEARAGHGRPEKADGNDLLHFRLLPVVLRSRSTKPHEHTQDHQRRAGSGQSVGGAHC